MEAGRAAVRSGRGQRLLVKLVVGARARYQGRAHVRLRWLAREGFGEGVPPGQHRTGGLAATAAAAADHDLGRQHHRPRRRGRIGDAGQQQPDRPLAQLAHRLTDGAEGGTHVAGSGDVVEPGHGHIRRDPQPPGPQRGQRPDRHLVVAAHDRPRPTPPGQQRRDGLPAAGLGEPAGRGWGVRSGQVSPAQCLAETSEALIRVRRAGRAGQERQVGIGMEADQVRGHRPAPAAGCRHRSSRVRHGRSDWPARRPARCARVP